MTASPSSNSVVPIEGVFSLLLTPFQPNGAIDWPAYDQYVAWQLAHEPSGLFAVCGSSEMKWLNIEERLALATRAVQLADGLPVVATANLGNDIAHHREELARMAKTGIAAAVLVPPPQVSHDEATYLDYLLTLAETAPCPLMLYEWPLVPNHTMSSNLFGELAQRGAVVGIKDTTGSLEAITAKQQVAANAVVYQADTALLPDALAIGVRGIMAITSTARTDLVLRFWHAFQHDPASAHELHHQLIELDALLEMSYPVTAKQLVAFQGIAMGTTTRAPGSLNADQIDTLRAWQQSTIA